MKRTTAVELGIKIKKHDISVKEAVASYCDAIGESEQKYHCFITTTKEQALEKAPHLQIRIDAGEFDHAPLAGVPIAVKDNICTAHVRTTAASRMLENFVPPYSATVVDKLNDAGIIMLGKTNMDEFAMGSTTETSFFGPTKNPSDVSRTPGGSSGGSAAAVASGEVPAALGSDTGGSIRQPASFCGVTGIKPTYGSVSRYGLIAFASSLDQIGPIGCDTADCAALLDVIVGYDRRDSTSIEVKERSYLGNLIKDTEKPDLKGMKIGLPRGYFGEGLDDDVRQAVTGAAKVLAGAGAELEEFDLKTTDYAIPTYYVLATAEASSNLSRFDGVKYGFRAEDYEGLHEMYRMTRSEGFGTEVKRRLMIGGFVLSSGYYDAYYNKALKVKSLIASEFHQAFEKYDLILGPTSPNTAGLLGASKGDPLKLYLSDIFTVSVNIAGLPAISVPCGSDSQGLPVGMQLIGKPFGERKILRAARVYEMVSE